MSVRLVSITPGSVPASGGTVAVTVNIAGGYGIGSVVETLPAGGFEYVSGSVVPSDIMPTESGREVTFPLVGESSFTYDVTVPGLARAAQLRRCVDLWR